MLWNSAPHMGETMTIRQARPRDAAAIARVYVDCWRETYSGILPQSYLDGLTYTAFERHWRRTFAARGWAYVAEVENKIIGIGSGGRCRRQGLANGEIYVLYVREFYQNGAVGRSLFDACHLQLAKKGFGDIIVWVLEENPARGFYEKLGGEFVARGEVTIGQERLPEVAYIWRD